MDPQAFFKAKRFEQEQRHTKFQDSPYSLEPNLKEAPGGLRDLQVVLWIGRAGGRGDTSPGRARRHDAAGRREDRLLFDFQDALARDLGYSATAHRRAGEQLMQAYFRAA